VDRISDYAGCIRKIAGYLGLALFASRFGGIRPMLVFGPILLFRAGLSHICLSFVPVCYSVVSDSLHFRDQDDGGEELGASDVVKALSATLISLGCAVGGAWWLRC